MNDRVILHCDCNSFFASVETVLNPSYRNVPMAVCGSEEDRHGIVLAKNELAKRYGIKTADTVYNAKRLCPSLVIARPHYDQYVKYSRQINAIYADYTDLVEPFGIDESWLDVSASRRIFGSGFDIAEALRRRVRDETGLTISIGVSFNKVFAKLGSDYKKPDATTVIDRDNFKSIVYPLPVSDLLFVGKRTADILYSSGIKTIGDLAEAPTALLSTRLGKLGEVLSRYARGEDDEPVITPGDDVKSISNGLTFKHDLVTTPEIASAVYCLSEEVGTRLREKGFVASGISVSLKDEFLHVTQHQRPLSVPTDISREIADAALSLIGTFKPVGKPIRSITVSVHNLLKRDSVCEQIDMFAVPDAENKRNKARKGEEIVDIIRRKHGADSIVRCSSIVKEK